MIKHLELFSGIGGFRKAIDLLSLDYDIPVECVGFSERDEFALRTYKANFDTTNELQLGDIELFTASIEKIKTIPDFTLLTGGFPCQSFSMMGKKQGFNDARGNTFYRIIDILNVKKPDFLILENVKNLKTHDSGNTFNVIIESLRNAGYKTVISDVFNSANFSLAQTRNRVFIFASRKQMRKGFHFSEAVVLDNFRKHLKNSSILKQSTVLDVLDKKVDSKYYLSSKLKKTVLADGSKNFVSKSEINKLTARPLTATMVKMHRACQDNYYSDDFIRTKNIKSFIKREFTKEELSEKPIRKLTPKEALALQGFDETFFLNAINAGLSNHQLYKQSGNAVSVNTVYAILQYLLTEHQIIK
jgi:DNA (cytosine-5)-methyltransferase 1